jgi:hypothetical protein
MMVRVPEAEAEYVATVVHRLRAVLAEELVGVYPTGSLALDRYTPGRSDIDLIAVVEHTPPPDVLRTIGARLSHAALPCPATGLEFVLCSRQAISAGGVGAGYALDLNTGRELPPKVSLDPRDGPTFWYAIDRSITYQSGTALTGPPPRALLPPVPFDVLMPVVIESLHAHLTAILEHGDNAVLNGCRALRFGAERRWYAKPAAARWAMRSAPAFDDLIASAIASHAAGRATRRALPTEDVTAFLDHVLCRLN